MGVKQALRGAPLLSKKSCSRVHLNVLLPQPCSCLLGGCSTKSCPKSRKEQGDLGTSPEHHLHPSAAPRCEGGREGALAAPGVRRAATRRLWLAEHPGDCCGGNRVSGVTTLQVSRFCASLPQFVSEVASQDLCRLPSPPREDAPSTVPALLLLWSPWAAGALGNEGQAVCPLGLTGVTRAKLPAGIGV